MKSKDQHQTTADVHHNARTAGEANAISAWAMLVAVLLIGGGAWFVFGWSGAVKHHAAAGQVTLTFTSDPSGAAVYIGGQRRGTTPLTLPATKGTTLTYRLTASEPYKAYNLYKPYQGTITPTKDEAVSVWLDRTTAAEQQAQKATYDAQQRAEAERQRQQKIAEAERQRQQELASIDLIIEGWSWTRDDRYQQIKYEGKVTNNTHQTLGFVQAHVEFYTANDDFISSDYTYLDITALLPGQSSTFTGYASWNPAAKTASIVFVDRAGNMLHTMTRKQVNAL